MSTKITRSHTTIIPDAKPLVKFGEKSPLVTKIVLGVIVGGLRPAPLKLKYFKRLACIELHVRGGIAKQVLFFFTKDPIELEREIRENWWG